MEHVSTHDEDGVTTLRLAGPADGNRLSAPLVAELSAAVRAVRKSQARVLVITGLEGITDAGKVEGLDPDVDDEEQARAAGAWLRGPVQWLVTALRELALPVVAAVDGTATGTSLALLLAADVRIASDTARVAVGDEPTDTLGAGLPWLLVHTLGRSRASSVLFWDGAIDAHTAHGLGLFDEVVEPDALLPRCQQMGGLLADRPTWFGSAVRRALLAAEELTLAESQQYASYLVEEALAGVR